MARYDGPPILIKVGRETVVPISAGVRRALERILRERPGIGDVPLFPSPEDARVPMTRHLADKWLRRAERLAGVEPLKGSLWHAYRRKWATERKHLPDVDVDVAQAGGWKSTHAMKASYQQSRSRDYASRGGRRCGASESTMIRPNVHVNVHGGWIRPASESMEVIGLAVPTGP